MALFTNLKQLLIIGHHWPEPKSSAAGSRMMQLIRLFLDANYAITFACASAKNKNAENLSSLHITEVEIKLNDSSFDRFLCELQPNAVLFDRYITEEQFGWRVTEHCPNALRILDTEDLHFLRKGRQEALKQNEDFNIKHLQNVTAKREIASIYRCDVSLIISEEELQLLTTKFNINEQLLLYVPFLLDEISTKNINMLPTFESREHFIFIGNFIHPPNYDAVLYLKQQIWKHIRQQLPKAELHIYGAYASEKVLQLHNEKQGFLIQGFADNVNTIMQNARVNLAPLRFGAGLKGKLIDAAKNGTPSIMTLIAAEGMFGDQKPTGFITDSVEDFAKKAVELYQNKSKFIDFQNNGFNLMNTRFQYSKFKTTFIERIEYATKNLQNIRQQNFIGQMLTHHTMQSTKFMSKWIEEKNK